MSQHKEPTVSVILPTFNRGKYIAEAVGSVLNQTYKDFELIIVDDGSTDNTYEILTPFIDKIHYIRQPNAGRSNARNHALKLAKGRYIAFIDSDDVFLPSKLELQVSFLDKNKNYGMIYTAAKCISEDGSLLGHSFTPIAAGQIYEKIAFFVPVTIALPTVMVRREILSQTNGFDEFMERFEDTDLWRRISKITDIGVMKEETCLIRTHRENSLDQQDVKKILSAIDYYASKIRNEDKEYSTSVIRKGISALYCYYGSALSSKSKWLLPGIKLLARSLYTWPFNLRPLALIILRPIQFLATIPTTNNKQ